MDVLEVGKAAVLAAFDDLDTTLGYFRALDNSRPAGVWELVPAARTVLVRFDPESIPHEKVVRWLRATQPNAAAGETSTAEVHIPVHYDGPDLDDVSEMTGLSIDEVISAHTGMPWTVAFSGFAPGFGYLAGGDARLHVPRRAEPRTAVPAGAVALASEFSGIYPRSSPGGWQLIGTTRTVIWDPVRSPPALLRPGTTVRFEAV
ncbi:allophanate hydrolase subunit 1 [Rhodococcus sp. NPDC058521]|uniref:5-oxoprolinase subunit B family protein n=1 Tax=Rhodococcus sp. NPDC058521 TaxID=3346536 RepID=UPI003648D407